MRCFLLISLFGATLAFAFPQQQPPQQPPHQPPPPPPQQQQQQQHPGSKAVNCDCQCDNFTWADSTGVTHGHCMSADTSGAKWCYTKSQTCEDLDFTKKHSEQTGLSRAWTYEGCTTPALGTPQCPQPTGTAGLPPGATLVGAAGAPEDEAPLPVAPGAHAPPLPHAPGAAGPGDKAE